ncbi:MAG TPA: hypothetical protein VJ992_05350 [Gemmatimonadales bacterium]|jgi:hypothetical protein|nr:hypothetical protein [Gemmatimonadales bacterium]
MFVAPTGVAGLVHRWAKFYDDRTSVSTAVTFIHLAGILVAGGFAIVADRASLRLSPTGDMDQMRQLDEIASVHRWVLIGLAVTFVSGILMFFSDLNTYLHSAVFWTKMGLIVLLLGNGYVRMRAEAALRRGVAVWRRFRQTSIASLALWFAVLLAGTILQNS